MSNKEEIELLIKKQGDLVRQLKSAKETKEKVIILKYCCIIKHTKKRIF